MPVRLLAGDRQLGGAMSWSRPAGLAVFPSLSPFNGLAVTDEIRINRQVLAEPSADLAGKTWAALEDGTPLVTEAPVGAGRVVLFHVTANADWSNLPLSGLFVAMLRRLVDLSVGVASPQGTAMLAPAETLDGFGLLSPPPPAAIGLEADKFASTPVSPCHPPGLYGPESGRQVLNLGTNIAAPELAPPIQGANIEHRPRLRPRTGIGTAVVGLGRAAALFRHDRVACVAGVATGPGLRDRRDAVAAVGARRPRAGHQWQPRDRHTGSVILSQATARWTASPSQGWKACPTMSTIAPRPPCSNPTLSSRARPT